MNQARMYHTEARVVSNDSLFPDVCSTDRRYSDIRLMWLDCPEVARSAAPGQFVMVGCEGLTLPRPLSIHRVSGTSIALFFAVLAEGRGTKWLAARRVGECIRLLGPLGNGFQIDSSARKLVLAAGGMGIAPLCFAADVALGRGLSVIMLLGARTASLVHPAHLLPQGADILTATDDGSAGHKGLVTSLIKETLPGAGGLLACGPLAMYHQMATDRTALGLDTVPVQLSLEVVMGCGHGACYSCTIKTRQGLRQVCQDGPVFDLSDIVWGEMGL